jgi:dTDP-4-dehydrorhamnose reductase
MSRWLVIGASGMLGWDLVAALKRREEDVAGLTHQDLDITNEAAVVAALRRLRPAVVVNCAAWTAVDEAEEHEDDALQVNGYGAGHIAAACGDYGARMFHISTDYVFSGDAQLPYSEWDATSPRTAYGRTKLVGERAVLQLLPDTGYVVRTAWLYGNHGPNFIRDWKRNGHPSMWWMISLGSRPGRPMCAARSSRWSTQEPRPVSTMPPAPGGRHGSGLPAKYSGCWALIRTG